MASMQEGAITQTYSASEFNPVRMIHQWAEGTLRKVEVHKLSNGQLDKLVEYTAKYRTSLAKATSNGGVHFNGTEKGMDNNLQDLERILNLEQKKRKRTLLGKLISWAQRS
ncbi:hypothetical protein C5B42_01075 [Candidatus Cerribacteria bacterium 'Amazon FNV 2010 28 9']|uniref:Uncharacterized protein n=1 Tax=Candidatus Cerribacteria bacterium 'Amazon FNV 2010 28 9' TaxID=2081795 RepID=A0A317JQR3_9BACT|nr:MAG: hypothetical protein C5B42_01075 [Candidatus Cerribacteria bacterium 'Amazon FNV 2010 28 9']